MTTTPMDAPLRVEPPVPATASVIWLHGLGADGHDFEALVPELGLLERGVRFVLPHAPFQPVTVNGGYVMRAWYDVRGRDLAHEPDESGIRASAAAVTALIDAEVARGIAPERIVLAGFSQGGAIVLEAGLHDPRPLAGILALSTYLPLPGALTGEAAFNRGVPVFMAHGTEDPVVPYALGMQAHDLLSRLGCAVEFHTYRMPHSLCYEEVADIRHWLGLRLSAFRPLARH